MYQSQQKKTLRFELYRQPKDIKIQVVPMEVDGFVDSSWWFLKTDDFCITKESVWLSLVKKLVNCWERRTSYRCSRKLEQLPNSNRNSLKVSLSHCIERCSALKRTSILFFKKWMRAFQFAAGLVRSFVYSQMQDQSTAIIPRYEFSIVFNRYADFS